MANNDQRQTVIVKEQFQNEVIIQSTLITFIVLNFIIVALYFITDMLGQPGHMDLFFSLVIGGMEFIGLVFVYRYSKQMSFRVAGPLFNMERKLMMIAEGDLTQRVTLRKNDYFHEVGDTINSVAEAYQLQLQKIKSIAQELDSVSNMDDSTADTIKKLLKEIDYFNTEKDTKNETGGE